MSASYGRLTPKRKAVPLKFAVAALLAMGCVPLAAQAPASAPAALPQTSTPDASTPAATTPATPPQIKDASIGFSYSLPADWETLASKPSKPDIPFPTVEGAKKGNACAQVELTARHGRPASVVVVVALPFDCYGQDLTGKSLADFAAGASEGLKQAFEVTEPVVSKYSLGRHGMWAERAQGVVKGQPNSKYTLEIACTVLAKGAACWMTMAADAASLQTFEQEAVTLEGDAFEAIVPASTFQASAPGKNKPS
jgi:hypothetical protein